jgi:hypothetical protein
MDASIIKVIESFASERQALAKRERELIARLNQALPTMGYRVVASEGRGRDTQAPPPPSARPAVSSAHKSLKCPHCDRRFAQPLHLGRHMSTTHKGAAAKPATSTERPAATTATSGKSTATPTTKRRRGKRRGNRRATAAKSKAAARQA